MTFLTLWMVFQVMQGLPQVGPGAAQEVAPSPVRCGADAFEPNEVRRRAKSTRGLRVEARICRADVDWYWLALEAGRPVRITLSGAVAMPEVFEPRRRIPVPGAYAKDGEAGVVFTPRSSGRHRVRISTEALSSFDYVMEVRIGR